MDYSTTLFIAMKYLLMTPTAIRHSQINDQIIKAIAKLENKDSLAEDSKFNYLLKNRWPSLYKELTKLILKVYTLSKIQRVQNKYINPSFQQKATNLTLMFKTGELKNWPVIKQVKLILWAQHQINYNNCYKSKRGLSEWTKMFIRGRSYNDDNFIIPQIEKTLKSSLHILKCIVL